MKKRIENDYFEWMYDIVCANRYEGDISYRKLLTHLHNTEFTYTIQKDSNRAEDGIDLRCRYGDCIDINNIRGYINGPCSVFEMMLALSIRCEETIMDDPRYGNRTASWFWIMINTLGLGGMTDTNFDEDYVNNIIDRFLNRQYSSDGRGGLFMIKNSQYDIRDVEIWTQLCYFLDSIP